MIMPRFLFRLDVSPFTGTGHLRRCLTLAEELKEQGADVFFACRLKSFNIEKYMAHIAAEWEEYDWSLTPEDDARKVVQSCMKYQVDSVIVDHYRADENYQRNLYESGIRWLQFDGAARFPFWADWVLNISPAASLNLYEGLRKRKETRFLLGPTYAPLRREFREFRDRQPRNRAVRTILLTFGGGDDRGATIFCLEAIRAVEDDSIEKIILLSSANPNMDVILKWNQAVNNNVRVIINAEKTANYMASADLAITAGGMTVFELASLGVPAIILQIADNQIPITRAWRQRGYGFDMGRLDRLHPEDLQLAIISLTQDAAHREAMSVAGQQMVDGLGAMRLAQVLLSREMEKVV